MRKAKDLYDAANMLTPSSSAWALKHVAALVLRDIYPRSAEGSYQPLWDACAHMYTALRMLDSSMIRPRNDKMMPLPQTWVFGLTLSPLRLREA